jgi:hypothetical protein
MALLVAEVALDIEAEIEPKFRTASETSGKPADWEDVEGD